MVLNMILCHLGLMVWTQGSETRRRAIHAATVKWDQLSSCLLPDMISIVPPRVSSNLSNGRSKNNVANHICHIVYITYVARCTLYVPLSLYNGPLHPALTAPQRSRGKNTEGNIIYRQKKDNQWNSIPFLINAIMDIMSIDASGGWVSFVAISSPHQHQLHMKMLKSGHFPHMLWVDRRVDG